MAGLMDLMNQNTRIERVEEIHCSQIERNPLNLFPIKQIDELKDLILEKGQKEPCQVYMKEGKYRLISGERRWTAISQLHEEGKHNGMIKCIVTSRYATPEEEIEDIYTFNVERDYSDNELLALAKDLNQLYDSLKMQGRKLGKRREWIGSMLHRSGKTIDKYLKRINADGIAEEQKPSKKSEPNISESLKAIKKTTEKEIKKYKEAGDGYANELAALDKICDNLTRMLYIIEEKGNRTI